MYVARLEAPQRKHFAQSKFRLLDWRACAFVNFLTLLVLCLWIMWDADITGGTSDSNSNIIHAFQSFGQKIVELDEGRRLAMSSLLILAFFSAVAWLGSTLIGQMVSRSIRSWMAITFAFAVWITSVGHWHDMAWHGENQRALHYIQHFEAFLSKLRSEWPQRDGQSSELGSFLAYNTPTSRSLLLLSCPDMPPGIPSFNGVERTPNGGMAFSLVGMDGGDWLEWHDGGKKPESFVTGLQQSLTLRRSASLGNGWYVVRYKN